MNELDLLKKIIDLEKSANYLNIQIELWDEGVEKKQYIADKLIVDELIEKYKKEIIEIDDRQFSTRAKQGIIDQINAYINEIIGKHPRLMLQRNQGTVLKNELFSLIARDIRMQVNGSIFGHNIPIDLYYTIEESEGVNIEQFINFLKNEIEIIKNIQSVNFMTLRNYYNTFQRRIIEQYIL
jgi:hypothetical protein